jgi:hypothetical protein
LCARAAEQRAQQCGRRRVEERRQRWAVGQVTVCCRRCRLNGTQDEDEREDGEAAEHAHTYHEQNAGPALRALDP